MKKRKTKRHKIIIPIASMGDIAFLLIIFFMVASHLARERYKLQPARSLDTVKLKEGQVSVAVDADGNYFVQGDKVGSVEEIEARLQSLLANRVGREKRTVMFRCDRAITKDQFEPVFEAIAKAGGVIAAVGDQKAPINDKKRRK